MVSDHCYRLRVRAAVESLGGVRQGRSRGPPRLKRILTYLEQHLFEPTLNVKRLKQVFGVRDSSLSVAFRAAFGRTAHQYIQDRRMETARRLLAEQDLRIWQIAELVGFSGLGPFTKAFSRWAGRSPSVVRKEVGRRSGGGRPSRPSGGEGRFADRRFAERRFADPGWLRRAVAGELPAAEARELIERLGRLYPSAAGSGPR